MTILECIQLIQNYGDYQIELVKMDWNRNTVHHVKHRFANKMIVPINAIANNVDFLLCKGDKIMITADNVECNVVGWKQTHICDLEDNIKELYKLDAWSFLKRWRKNDEHTSDMYFIELELQKK